MTRPKLASNWDSPGRIASAARWERQSARMGRGVTQAAVDAAAAAPGLRILDLACGSGAPSIPLARLVAPGGLIIGLDLSREPLKVARSRAAERDLTNILYVQGNAQALPFPDGSFDRVTCRFGAMFFPDPAAAFREAGRVLRRGGRIALVVWGDFQQPYFAATMQVVMRHTGGEIPSPARLMFRFADPQALTAALQEAGFKEVRAERQTVEWLWPGRPKEVWEYFQEATVPFKPLLDRIRPEQRATVDREVVAALERYFDGENVNLTADIVVATGLKT